MLMRPSVIRSVPSARLKWMRGDARARASNSAIEYMSVENCIPKEPSAIRDSAACAGSAVFAQLPTTAFRNDRAASVSSRSFVVLFTEEPLCFVFSRCFERPVCCFGELVPDGLCVLEVAFEVATFEEEVDARGGAPR